MESKPNMKDLDDDAEETLSLCDLPIYSTEAADWEDFSKEDQSFSSISSDQEDYFEFFSTEEFISSTTSCSSAHHQNSIIFCGKLIPYKEAAASIDTTQKLENTKQQPPRKRGLFRWKNLDSFNKPKTSKSNESSSVLPVSAGKCDKNYDFSVQRLSILASPTKSRWHLFMFGLARFPTEMDLSEMKNRQSRRRRQRSSTLFRSDGGDEKVAGGGGSRGKGLWGLIRSLGCGRGGGDYHANAVVKASLRSIPRE
uniref:Uncharacterized protein n=1 Tax=Davidia involucrata TaxID=16924 RepID=A0A5B6YNT0_DAVIN